MSLEVTLDPPKGRVDFLWLNRGQEAARGHVVVNKETPFCFFPLQWTIAITGGKTKTESGSGIAASVHATLRRWRKLLPVEPWSVRLRVTAEDAFVPLGDTAWQQVGSFIYQIMKPHCAQTRSIWQLPTEIPSRPPSTGWRLQIECYTQIDTLALCWIRPPERAATINVIITLSTRSELRWITKRGEAEECHYTSIAHEAVLKKVTALLQQWPVVYPDVSALWITPAHGSTKQKIEAEPAFTSDEEFADLIVNEVESMVEEARKHFSPALRMRDDMTPEAKVMMEMRARKEQQKRERDAEERAKREATMRLLAEKRRAKEQEKERHLQELAKAKEKALAATQNAEIKVQKASAPLPSIAVRCELRPLEFQETSLPLHDLRHFLLLERAAQWWVSNQSDDLLCLPHCRIQRLEHQVRTALRVLGPLRGRALLSDEVGLGKTIEAGLVVKELLTRGLARRVLVLTVPSLVDQWQEELADKFSLDAATTNHPDFRSDAPTFWRTHSFIVASLHTLKQPAQLAVAKEVAWDCLVVDEAHHLRNRDSQAWQAVNVLPRQYLLLLTATPVQNSLEELYNLVTLLQPGQLPSPKEFRARHMDPKRPRQPRAPEELRRLLGQVMVRNTRANSGIDLPPRHAETVLFEPDDQERAFWSTWEIELRAALTALPANQSSLWGRLLLQAAGSSPAAWQSALKKFPDKNLSAAWSAKAPLLASWQRKCALLPPLARIEGGCVVFTQFLDTQAALVDSLTAARINVWSINGSTPAAERQPIVEKFRLNGGVLLLTQSGTEGRNLQFCHQLVNFDLPWNPMEIEQRIGRLHRLGQKHPVRIFNLVQQGTLQEHLLTILQEKLNLFELVVGETGLVLGDKFSSDEFAEEILRRWRDAGEDVAGSFASLGEELAAARAAYGEVQELDQTLFAQDYETP